MSSFLHYGPFYDWDLRFYEIIGSQTNFKPNIAEAKVEEKKKNLQLEEQRKAAKEAEEAAAAQARAQAEAEAVKPEQQAANITQQGTSGQTDGRKQDASVMCITLIRNGKKR